MVIIVYAVPLQKRPKYQGWFGAIFGIASVLGPTVGGAFTTHVSLFRIAIILASHRIDHLYRLRGDGAFTSIVSISWNLRGPALANDTSLVPIGGVVMALVFFLLHVPEQPGMKKALKDKLQQINPLGMAFLVPGVVCLCLVLQYGGNTYNVRLHLNFARLHHLECTWLIRKRSGVMVV